MLLMDAKELELLVDSKASKQLKNNIKRRIEKTLKEEPDAKLYLAAAKKHQEEGKLEVDGNAVVSIGTDNGAYVQAWIWVGNSEI
jgi:hypothetical protein